MATTVYTITLKIECDATNDRDTFYDKLKVFVQTEKGGGQKIKKATIFRDEYAQPVVSSETL